MTLDEIKAMNEDFISAAQAASVMKMDVGRLIGYARKGELPFPAVISGNRVKIPRAGFLKFLGVEIEEKKKQTVIEDELKTLHNDVRVLTAAVIGILSSVAPEIALKLMAEKEGAPQ